MKAIVSLAFLGSALGHVIQPVVQPGYVSPHATGYIYRSDNDGPASLIQLGVPYQQPHAFAPPLPIAGHHHGQQLILEPQPVYEVVPEPAPLPYVAAQPIVIVDEEDDDDDDDDYLDNEHVIVPHHGHGHGYEKGEGSDYGEEHHAAHGEKGSKGYNSANHHAKGASGHYSKGDDQGHYAEAGGEASSSHDESDAHGAHHDGGKGYKGGDQGHKKHFSKGEDVTGYHKVFNKEEFKKDHDFYDVEDNNGHFNKHGYEKGHHGSEEAAHKEGGHAEAAYEKGESGKAGYHAKGHHDENDLGHSAEEGEESHYSNEEEYGKKGAGSEGKEFAYADGHDDDDDDDDYYDN